MTLAELIPNATVDGLVRNQTVTIISVAPFGVDSAKVIFRDGANRVDERMFFDGDLRRATLTSEGQQRHLTTPADDFKLAAEAYRIKLGFLFDPMMAVHTSDVIPLPHQISAVYESMLPRQPLRYVLADDPGAGKTIMAGLLLKELALRSDAEQVLIVAPGSLVEQWQDELYSKFGLEFEILTTAMLSSGLQNPFVRHPRLIARLDQLKRAITTDDEDEHPYEHLIQEASWDLIIFDEAHKLAARYFGNEMKRTKRYRLGELLGSRCRHLLLMTATPHNGKPEDFEAFMALLDSDRFYGKQRDASKAVDVSDLMRRMVKEELVKFDGKPLFPERRAYSIFYELSDQEAMLYNVVTDYVKDQMNAADRLDGRKKGSVGFALTILQRRLASSPEAIYQSLHRRRVKLELRLQEARISARGQQLLRDEMPRYPMMLREPSPGRDHIDALDEMLDDLDGGEREDAEMELSDGASAAQTIDELDKEVKMLVFLEEKARELRDSQQDAKWREVNRILQDNGEMYREDGSRRKLIVFTEHKDTLNYLADRIRGVLGHPESVQIIYGGTPRDERRKIQERFRSDPEVLVLVATDAAGEGVNLQTANLMINYDLPWNPNRLEQRFGRIHRIGQEEVCHLWNLVAKDTREGQVFERIFDKLEVERVALNGRVYDILGEIFEGHSLKDLLLDAIKYTDDPATRAKLDQQVDSIFDHDRIRAIANSSALAKESISPEHLFSIKAEMQRAEARKLQPHFVQAFFEQAFAHAGGQLIEREANRFEIRHVPAALRNRDRVGGLGVPVLTKYERICFRKEDMRIRGRATADLMHPGHPLMSALIDETLANFEQDLKLGTVLCDEEDLSVEPRVLFFLHHGIEEAAEPGKYASQEVRIVEIDRDHGFAGASVAAYLDYRALTPAERALAQPILSESWLGDAQLEHLAHEYAMAHVVPDHQRQVAERREQYVDKALRAVHERLSTEIAHQNALHFKLNTEIQAGKKPRVNLVNKERLIEELSARLKRRTSELEGQRELIVRPPTIKGVALVLPKGYFLQRRGEPGYSADALARRRIEVAAVEAVMAVERSLGHVPRSRERDNCGYDIESSDGEGNLRMIEVKGRAAGATEVTITKNEILTGLNAGARYFLAVAYVEGEAVTGGPYYVQDPFTSAPGADTIHETKDLRQLLARATDMHAHLQPRAVPGA